MVICPGCIFATVYNEAVFTKAQFGSFVFIDIQFHRSNHFLDGNGANVPSLKVAFAPYTLAITATIVIIVHVFDSVYCGNSDGKGTLFLLHFLVMKK